MQITFAATTPGTVYRALRDDVAFPFVTVADGPGYDEVHVDGVPEGRGGVIVIEPFEEPSSPPGTSSAGNSPSGGATSARACSAGSRATSPSSRGPAR